MNQLALVPIEPPVSLAEAARRAGASERQVHHWVKIGLVDPLWDEHGEGRWGGGWRFTAAEVRFLRAIVRLVRAGVDVGVLARAQQSRTLPATLHELRDASRAAGKLVDNGE